MTDGMFLRLSWQAVRIILLRTLCNYPVIKYGSVWRQPEGGDMPVARLLLLYLKVVEVGCCRHAMLHPRKRLGGTCLSNGCCIMSVWSTIFKTKLSECFFLETMTLVFYPVRPGFQTKTNNDVDEGRMQALIVLIVLTWTYLWQVASIYSSAYLGFI